jgi:hypothetical protein
MLSTKVASLPRPWPSQAVCASPPGARADESGATVARNALYLVTGQAATTVLAIVVSAALGRFLGAKDFGTYYLIATMSTFAYVFVEWGQPLLVIRQAARDPLRSGELLGTALVLRAAFALVVIVPAGAIAWALGYGAHTTRLSVFLILASLPLFLAQGYGMVFRARDQMGRDAVVSISNKAIALGVMLPALALGAGIPGVIVAQAVAGLAALVVAARLYRRLGAPPLNASSQTARELLAAGAPILAMTAASAAQPYLDAIILSKLAPAVVVGWFGAARNVLGTLLAPAAILGAAAYPAHRAGVHGAGHPRTEREVGVPAASLARSAGRHRHLPVRGHGHRPHLRRRGVRAGGHHPPRVLARALPDLHRHPAREHHLRLRRRDGVRRREDRERRGGDGAGPGPDPPVPTAAGQRRGRGWSWRSR